jgi:hypothetical protein
LDFIIEENVDTERNSSSDITSSRGNSRGMGGGNSGDSSRDSDKNGDKGSGSESVKGALTDTNYSLKKSSSINSSINMENLNNTHNHNSSHTSININNGDVSSLNSNYQIEEGLPESSTSKSRPNDPYYEGADGGAPSSSSKTKSKSPTLSFLQYPLIWLHSMCHFRHFRTTIKKI